MKVKSKLVEDYKQYYCPHQFYQVCQYLHKRSRPGKWCSDIRDGCGIFKDCVEYPNKGKCWKIWDEEYKQKVVEK